MKPTADALQFFYGSIPVLLVLLGIMLRESNATKAQNLLLTDVLARLGGVEKTLREWMPKIEGRLSALEARSGIVYHGE